jgi:predicted dehydrogenase
MTETLKVGVIGCGAIAQMMHIPYLLEYEQFQLVAICDAYHPVLDAVGDRFGIQQRYTDHNDLLANADVEAVIICHAGSHRDTILAALDAGKHILVEKPIAWNLREAQEVAERVARSDRIVQLAYHKIYDPAFAYTRNEISKMQDLAMARITVLHPANELGFSPHRIRRGNGAIDEGHIDPGTWEGQLQGQLRAFAGGDMAPLVDEALGAKKDDQRLRLAYGLVTVSLIHQIYMMHGLMGDPLRVISTEIWRDGFSIHSVVEYPNYVRCILDWHFLSHLKDYREEYAFFGNHDRVFLRFPSPYFRNFPSPVTVQGGDGELAWEKTITVSLDEAFKNELLAFYDCVVNNKTPMTTVTDAVKHMRFGQALIDAAT